MTTGLMAFSTKVSTTIIGPCDPEDTAPSLHVLPLYLECAQNGACLIGLLASVPKENAHRLLIYP